MKKYIVLSVNDNPEYMFYLPLTVWAWRKFGWEPIIFVNGDVSKMISTMIRCGVSEISNWHEVNNIKGYRSETITQISRLYGSCVADGYLMTGDIDMIPLSDYWKPDEKKITVWGHDLTGYQHYPICYIGMPANLWRRIMDISLSKFDYDYNKYIERDLDSMPNASSEDSVKRWVIDQDHITDRLNKSGVEIEKIHRGTYTNGYPEGRVDRSAWTKEHSVFIDAHLPRGTYYDNESFVKMNLLLHWVWPNEDFTWFYEYIEKFKQLVNG